MGLEEEGQNRVPQSSSCPGVGVPCMWTRTLWKQSTWAFGDLPQRKGPIFSCLTCHCNPCGFAELHSGRSVMTIMLHVTGPDKNFSCYPPSVSHLLFQARLLDLTSPTSFCVKFLLLTSRTCLPGSSPFRELDSGLQGWLGLHIHSPPIVHPHPLCGTGCHRNLSGG